MLPVSTCMVVRSPLDIPLAPRGHACSPPCCTPCAPVAPVEAWRRYVWLVGKRWRWWLSPSNPTLPAGFCMTSSEESDHLSREQSRWQEQTLGPAISRLPERKPVFKNTSGIELHGVYTPAD